jgi:hypothetical protein
LNRLLDLDGILTEVMTLKVTSINPKWQKFKFLMWCNF